MEYLYLEGFWLDKKDQPLLQDATDWKKEFELD